MTLLLIALLVVAGDQLAKGAVMAGAITAPWIEPGRNHDLALGILGGPAVAELIACAGGLILAWVLLGRRATGPLAVLAGGLVIGGAASNLLDRAVAGSVLDYLVGPGILFNLADVALVLGMGASLAARRSPIAHRHVEREQAQLGVRDGDREH